MTEPRWNSQLTVPFIVAAGALLTVPPEPDAEYLDEPSLMFLTGPSNIRRARRDAEAVAKRSAKDVILLQFIAGSEGLGPQNIVVFEHRVREFIEWKRCRAWSAESGSMIVIPDGADFGFAYDGSRMVRIAHAMQREQLDAGFEIAEIRIMIGARRATGIDLGSSVNIGKYH